MNCKFAILGGSSQVGSSLAMYLHIIKKVDVTAFTRSTYSQVFYSKLGINSEILPEDSKLLREKLSSYDAIIDFTIPHSDFWVNHTLLKEHIFKIMRSMPLNCPYISISSQNAFGFNDDDVYIKKRFFDWASPYCSLKRFGENYVNKMGKEFDIPVFNLRLGQVHGFLQSVSNRFSNEMTTLSQINVYGDDIDYTNTLFISDLAAAVLLIAERSIKIGTYSVLSVPQWSQKQLYEYYRAWNKIDKISINYIGHRKPISIFTKIQKDIFKKIESYRGFIDVVILQRNPWLAIKAKGFYRIRSFLNHDKKVENSKVLTNLLGKPKANILGNVIGSPKVIMEEELLLQEAWHSRIGTNILMKFNF